MRPVLVSLSLIRPAVKNLYLLCGPQNLCFCFAHLLLRFYFSIEQQLKGVGAISVSLEMAIC